MGSGRGPSFLRAITRDIERPWTLRNATSGRIVASSVIPAFERATRNKGLLGRRSLEPGSAMILAPCSSIHTFFMQFAIDVAFVDRDGRVVRARRALGPWRIQAALRASAVIELATGSGFFKVELDRALALVDDAVSVQEIDDARARTQLEVAQAELAKVDAGESQADRWQLEQRIKHAENQLSVSGRTTG